MAFTMVSWNILAPVHVRPERYPRVTADLLDGPHRLAHVIERLRLLNPDVIALQEVEPAWAEALHDGLRDRDYDWRLTLKQGGQFEGVALFLRRGRFGLVRFEEMLYREQSHGVEPTGNVALFAHCHEAGQPLLLVNTHIKWEPPDVPAARHRGVIQVRQLADRLRAQTASAVVVCGDFNATTASPVLEPLWTLGFHDPFAAANQPTGAFNRVANRIDFLVHSPALTARVDRLPELTNESVLPSALEPSDHLLLLATLEVQPS